MENRESTCNHSVELSNGVILEMSVHISIPVGVTWRDSNNEILRSLRTGAWLAVNAIQSGTDHV